MIALLTELLGPLLPWIGGAVAGLALFWGHGRREREKGRSEAVSEAKEKDRKNADSILDRVDDVDGVPDNYRKHYRN